jgi:DNA topoisomerase VI subunit A
LSTQLRRAVIMNITYRKEQNNKFDERQRATTISPEELLRSRLPHESDQICTTVTYFLFVTRNPDDVI